MKRIVFFLIPLVACGGMPEGDGSDGGMHVTPDGAGGTDSSQASETICGGKPLPTTAAQQITLRGNVFVGGSASLQAGSTVELWESDAAPLTSVTTSSTGSFGLTPMTGYRPIAGFLRAMRTGYHDGYYYPSTPFADSDYDLSITVSDDSDMAWYANGTPDPSRGAVWVTPQECDGSLIAGAKIAVSSATTGEIRYIDRDHYHTYTAPSASTVYAVFYAPAGPVTITVTQGTRVLRTAYVEVHADAVSFVDVLPQ